MVNMKRRRRYNKTTGAVAVVVTALFFLLDSPAAKAQRSGPTVSNEHDLDNWPRFRGPQSIPVSDNPKLPDHWSTTENVEWVAEVPGVGWSSPIVWGGKVFLTSATSEQKMKQPSLGTDFSNEYMSSCVPRDCRRKKSTSGFTHATENCLMKSLSA
jgi:hypothetical protein